MDEFGWQIQKSRKSRKSNNPIDNRSQPAISTEIRSQNRSFGARNVDSRANNLSFESHVAMKGNINKWVRFACSGNIEKIIDERIKSLSFVIDGRLERLWDCVFGRVAMVIPERMKGYMSGFDLKDEAFLKIKEDDQSDDTAIEYICERFHLELRIICLDSQIKDICYGKNNQPSVVILHAGFDYFLPLKPQTTVYKNLFTAEEKKSVNNLNQIQEKRASRSNLVADRKLLDEISKRLRGIAKAQEIDEFYSSKAQRKNAKEKALCYDIYSPIQLDKMENLIICKLKLLNAHSGVANPLERTSEMKYKIIKLNSRRNCGFNAFCDDVVYVKINDSVNHTGKVMGVHESTHKPVNNFYICKVSRDQGTLMIPINNFFPKIHVDNEPGRRKYEQDIQDIKGNRRIRDEQKSVVDREKESRNYADNIYYSLYKLSNNKSNNTILFTNYQKVVKFNPETCDNFFIVIYERWDPHFMYPTGKIIGVLSTYDTLDDNFHLISSICNVTAFENTAQIGREIHEIERKSKCFVTDNYIPPGAMVFTIDNETTTDMDDAISYHKEGNNIVIGVHISDVTKYISSTHELYQQALNRFCTTYPPKFCHIPPIHLFGDKLSTDILSLVPKKPRAVVSVFFKFTEKMQSTDFKLDEIINPKFREGVIISKHKLNYESVSFWLKQTECPSDCPSEDLFIALKEIYEIARKLRHARLPESYFVRSTNEYLKDFDIKNQFEGEMLIEEFMILVNEYVAKKIYERYPENTLLRMQNKVNDHEEWIEELFRLTNMNFTARLKEYCNLLNVNISDSGNMRGLVVSRRFYDKFSEFLSKEDTVEKARNLLQYDDFYNDFYVHITKWYKLSVPARYICSIKDSVSNGHFSLAKPLYTHFTSPIRRFTDVIVHRLLKSVINGTEITDSSLDINEVCDIANTRLKENRTFEKLCAPFAIFNETDKMFCFILDCVCGEINNTEIKLVHPMLQKAASEKTVKFSDLSLDEVPLSLAPDRIAEKCILKWRKIIFTCLTETFESSDSNKFPIDNHLFDCKLHNSYWRLFRKIRRSYMSSEELKDKLIKLQSKFKPSSYDKIISSDSISISNPIIDIELEIFVKNTMRIQFCKYQMNGLQKISPELYIVTPTFEICMIHKNDPVRFFIPGGKLELKHNDIKKIFSDIEEYKEYFKPLIHVESLSETLGENPAFTLLKVPIKWIVCRTKNKYKQRYGVIMLSYGFCKTRNVIFNDENDKIIDRYEYLIDEGIDSVGGDLLCLRCRKKGWENFWVGHGEIVHVGKCKIMSDIFKVIVFRLTQWDFEWFSNETDDTNYSVDVYMKSVVSKRQEEAVNSIDKHSLLKEVILGINVLSEMIDNNLIDHIQEEIEGKKNFKFNDNQKIAMKNAMNQKLSLIWGPPGTGKTHIGCILSYAFKLKNELRAQNGVVLYCGPSNDCVNLVAVEMKKKLIDNSPKILRIFGEQQELVDFPLPGFLSKNNTQLTEEMKEISLHHLIRQTGNTYADALRKYDTKFNDILNNSRQGRRGEETREEIHSSILAYKETLKEAKLELIKNHHFDMVLCTTSVTATNIMQNFNIVQVIIDEAGMCKEPETLIPISSTEKTVENVVLIGDHKQLRPIIHSKIANKRGLQISLFERYQELRPELVTMLNYQYRMHPSICEFPSRQFYNGRLITQISHLWSGLQPENVKCNYAFWNGIDYEKCKKYYESILIQTGYNAIPNEQWPGCREVPYTCFRKYFSRYPERLVFINVIGDEVIQSVSTATGNENSRGNYLEVEAVGHIYQKIIEGFPYPRLAPEHITVLTQYKLQQFLLQKKCKDILISKRIKCTPVVKTVIRSQGSENDYIIFSTVRSLRNKEDINDRPTPGWEKQYLGFITDPNQINVALTRAKKGLIIIGNKNLLRVNGIWKKLINDLEIRNCVIDSYLDFLR